MSSPHLKFPQNNLSGHRRVGWIYPVQRVSCHERGKKLQSLIRSKPHCSLSSYCRHIKIILIFALENLGNKPAFSNLGLLSLMAVLAGLPVVGYFAYLVDAWKKMWSFHSLESKQQELSENTVLMTLVVSWTSTSLMVCPPGTFVRRALFSHAIAQNVFYCWNHSGPGLCFCNHMSLVRSTSSVCIKAVVKFTYSLE